MHKKRQTIIAELTEMAQNGLAGQSADDLLITRIDALNRLCDIYEEESISTAPLQSLRTALYPQLIVAIESRDIADSAQLVKALYRLIYDNALGDDAPRQWVDTLTSLANRYLEACEPEEAPADYVAMLAYSVIGAPQEQYDDADSRCNRLLDTLADSDLTTMPLSRRIGLLYARITTAGTFSFPSSTAPSWADLASTLATLLTPGDTAPGDTPSTTPENAGSPSPLSALSDTDLRRWHTTLTRRPPLRRLPAPDRGRAPAAAPPHLASRPSLHAYFVNNDFVS